MSRLIDRLRRVPGDLVDLAGGVRVVLPDGRPVRVAYRSRGLAAGHEPLVVERFLGLLRPDMTVADVGAHWGLYTLLAAGTARRVIAFEPSRENARILRRNVSLAGAANVEVRQEVVSDVDGDVPFFDYAGRAWGTTMMTGQLAHDSMTEVLRPGVRLDSLADPPDLIKMDVEGVEERALRGAARLLETGAPILVLEVHSTRLLQQGSSEEALAGWLVERGYDITRLDELTAAGGERVCHWLCLPA
jgi:FkbM family methyltransferase